jgi:hypothetical protein
MLVSQSLIKHGSFAVDHFNIPRLEPAFHREDYVMNGDIYQLEVINGHIYYFFPPGSSVLSTPFVALMNLFGIKAVNPDGTFNHQGEITIETGLAALLMAALAVIFFLTSRLLLPLSWSALVALAGALGTQVWSTASRGLWSHTWAIFLLGIIIFALLATETGRWRLRPALLATLLAWMYFVRPNSSIFIIAISVYLFLYYRHALLLYTLTGALWLALFVLYSWHNFGHLLPSYYRANRLRFDAFLAAFPGNLISPSRGLFIFVPVLLFVFYLLVRYYRELPLKRLVWLALIVLIFNLIAISGFSHWWGGASFGPRLSTEVVPWCVLLGILGLKGYLSAREKQGASAASLKHGLELAAGALLLSVSVFINARGALSVETWKWNEQPKDVALMYRKLWDWRQPQFLAGLMRPPLDHDYPLVETRTRIDFTRQEANQYLWYGWSGPEAGLRWSEAKEAALVFSLREIKDVSLRLKLMPFLAKGLLDEQRLTVELNGQPLETQSFREIKDYQLSLKLPAAMLREQNVLVFKLPDAVSPESLKLTIDQRPLGIAVKWMELEPETAAGS